jgi:hypothetical protein
MSEYNFEIFHPIRLLARPDGELTTVFHSVVLCSIDRHTGLVDVVAKHPPFRKNIETVEDGIRAIIMDHVAENPDFKDVDSSCTFVLTNHDGRLYVYASISKARVVAVVCSLPLFSFCRKVLERISEEAFEVMLPIVYTMCEMPVFPMPNLKYNFQFNGGTIDMHFDALESIRDSEVQALVLSVMSPQMIVRAWEALIVERRILVTSSFPSLLLPCCELVRKLISPLPFMGAFIPELPASGVEAIEAPGTFIIGVEANTLRKSSVDMNGIVILDLDRRQVIFTPSSDDDPYYAAPPAIITSLLQNINSIIHEPAAAWFNRPIQVGDSYHPFLQGGSSTILSNVSRLFVKLNVSILSAQFCRIKAFYRSLVNKDDTSGFYAVLGTNYRSDGSIPIGYSDQFGYKVGCVQLWKSNENKEDTIHHTIPCWMEMNDFSLSVYEQADDLPLLFLPIVEFDAIESCALEPDGHVFQLSLKNALVFRFTAADPESRQLWLTAIEQKINLALQATEKKVFSVTTAEKQQSMDFPLPVDKGTLPSGQSGNATPFAGGGENVARFTTANIGIQPLPEFVPTSMAQHYHDFRHLIQSTQMVLSLYSLTECAAFDSVFPGRSDSLAQYVSKEHSFEAKMTKYLGALHRAADIVEKITKSVQQPTDEIPEFPWDGDEGDVDSAFSDSRMTQSVFADHSPSVTIDKQSVKQPTASDRPTFLQRFFSRKRQDDSVKEDQRLEELERENEQRNQQILMEHMQETKTMYNRCLAELSYLIVDDRIQFMKNLNDSFSASSPPGIMLPITSIGSDVLTHLQSKIGRNLPSSTTFTAHTPDPRPKSGGSLTWDSHARLYEGLASNHILLVRRKGNYEDNSGNGHSFSRGSSRRTNEVAKELSLTSLSVKEVTLSEGEMTPTCESDKLAGMISHKDIESMNLSAGSDDDDVYVDVEATDILANDQATNYNEYLNQVQQLVKIEVEKYLKTLLEDMEDVPVDVRVQSSDSSVDISHNAVAFLESPANSSTRGPTPTKCVLRPILRSLHGYCLQNLDCYEDALTEYAEYNLIDPTRVTYCLLQVFLSEAEHDNFVNTFSEPAFIARAYRLGGKVLALHAYRLILELIHAELKKQVVAKKTIYWNSPKISLGDFRVYPRTESALRNQEYMMASGKKLARSKSVVANDFVAEENEFKSEILNETFICKRLNTDASAVELSIHLLQRLKEVLKAYAQGPTGNSNWKKRTNNGMLKIKIVPEAMQEIQRLSAFKKFEAESCQLQRIELNNLNVNERIVLFVNAFNTLMIHSCIVKGNPGANLLERTAFLRSARYNIGGHIFSLLDIEHGILRNASTKPMVLGPLSLDMSFAANDPRRKYALDESKPNVSFVLFLACPSSPPLSILSDTSHVDKEMTKLTQQFFQDTVKFDAQEKVINMPALLRVYWADFTDKPNHVLKYVAKVCGPKFHAATKEFLAHIGNSSMKTHFQHFDWTPVFVIPMR